VTLLAAAGILEGRKATTNWFDRERIATYGAEFVESRYHRDGKYLTGAGVSARIDTALHFAQLVGSDSIAQTIQLGIEYYPQPPFPEKSPAESSVMAQHRVEQFELHGAPAMLQVNPPFAGLSLRWPEHTA
jgi:transcriptional regulator GlxA family with amidase domain